MLSLICEGRCNPNLPALDAAIAEQRDSYSRDEQLRPTGPLEDWLIAALREQHHTPHQRLGAKYVCQQCGQARQY